MSLPSELILQVFRWATWPPPHVKLSAEYTPFSSSNVTVAFNDPSIELKLKYNLALVSRQWRDLATEFLYEHIAFRRTQTDEIVPSPDWLSIMDYGRYAMSVQICRSLYADQPSSDLYEIWALIFHHCPNVKLILRPWWGKVGAFSREHWVLPANVQMPSSSNLPLCFANVTRLEWEYSSHFNIQLFRDIAQRLPNLRWLSLTSIVGAGTGGRALESHNHRSLHLSQLTTLCLRIENASMYRSMQWLTLPKLTHLIIEEQDVNIGGANARIMRGLFEKLGQTLEVLELGRGKYKHFRQSDVVSLAVTMCPKLHTLSYYVLYTTVPSASRIAIVAKSLRHIHLHAEAASGFDSLLDLAPMHMLQRIVWFRRFEELDYLTLHGDWTAILQNPEVSKALSGSRWIVKFENGTAWP
ncbi:hypothetical protein NEOLEDRAFT_1126640 [Neolentinus lepideus HHB14362 ss-1]|uniref:Uncharacterized protein n=1 Tax=Neolentinus lepideus HHB14362 ss-1 TaxID=1314782 RepID=A0A165WBU0_9AGAM|nr:hypothetical protein NEOLEDRAFT_1126640 [Neolentinus lepideus HHB14362 ss-1]